MKYDFDPVIAKDIWVEEAIMYSNIKWRCEKNKANGKHFYDGYYRTYNSMEAFCKLFTFRTKEQIKRIIYNLEKKSYLKVWWYNNTKYDRTKRYAPLVDFIHSSVSNDTIDFQKWHDDIIYTDNKPNNKTYNTPDGDFITLDFVSSTAQGEAEQKIGVAKFTKQKIDYSSELNQLQEIWNEADKWLKIPKAKVITDKAKQRYAVLRKTFSWELIAEWFDNYFDFVAKKKPWDLYYDHRFSFSDFIVNQYWLEKYAS